MKARSPQHFNKPVSGRKPEDCIPNARLQNTHLGDFRQQRISDFETLKSDYQRSLRAGASPDLERLVERYPQWAEEIRCVFPLIELIESNKNSWPDVSDRLGDYRLLLELGRGGSARVYEAKNETTGQHVAIKVFHSHAPLSKRAAREAAISSKLDHPNIVRTYDYFEEDGVTCLVMQLIRGVSLATLIRRAEKSVDEPGYPIGDLNAVAMIGADMAAALQHAHRRGVLHRDIKPANMMMDSDGTILLTDFGCGKNSEGLETQSGVVIGTLRYMPQEQIHGKATQQSDIYSLAVSLRELLNCSPNTGVDLDQKKKLQTILSKASARSPRKRFQTAAEFERALVEFVCVNMGGQLQPTVRERLLHYVCAATVIVAVFFAGWRLGGVPQRKLRTLAAAPFASNYVVDVNTGVATIEIPITSSNGDAEQREDGQVNITSESLNLIWDDVDQVVGLRFPGLRIPNGARVTKAFVQFYSDESDLGDTRLVIHAEAAPNAAPFQARPFDISLRTLTESRVVWNPPPWIAQGAGPAQRTPNCGELIQEVLDHPEWTSGNALALVISGSGYRSAVSADGSVAASPRLCVEFIPPRSQP